MFVAQTSSTYPFLDKSKEEIAKEFTAIPNVYVPDQKPDPHKFATGLRRENYAHRNRYGDIIAQDNTRVVMPQMSLNYINANHCLKGRVILAQGPMTPGDRSYLYHHRDFYHMLWTNDSTAIAMVTDYVEKGANKCSVYIPQNGTSLPHVAPYTVTAYSGEDIQDTTLKLHNIRTTLISIQRDGIEKKVYHYHYPSWGDGQGTEGKAVAALAKTVLQHNNPVIHCSAGIGRSGTLAAVVSAYLCIQEAEIFDKEVPSTLIPDVVTELRSERHGSVQTLEQYQTIYDAVGELLEADEAEAQRCEMEYEQLLTDFPAKFD